MIVIAHNYVHVLEMCDRVNLLRNGRIELDKRTDETSVEELTEIVGRRVPADAVDPHGRLGVTAGRGRNPLTCALAVNRSSAGKSAGAATAASKEVVPRFIHIVGLFDSFEFV